MPFYIPNETAEGIAIGAGNWDNMLGNIMQLQKQQNADRAAMRSRQAQRTEELENDALYINSGGGGRGSSHGGGGYSGQGGGSAYISPSNTVDPNTNNTPNERLRDKNSPILSEQVDETGQSLGTGNPYTIPVIMPDAVNALWDETMKYANDPAYQAKYANTPLYGKDIAAKQAYLNQYGDKIYADQANAIANTPGLAQPTFINRMASGDPRSNARKRAAILQLQGR